MTAGMFEERQIDNPQAVLAELMRRDFRAFLRKACPAIRGGQPVLWNWHLDAIASALNRVAAGESLRLLVTMPPRNLKSIAISVAWVAWMLGRDPRRNFVCISYSNELSAKHGRDCCALIESNWYRELFPGTLISAKRSASADFETTRGGGRLATSLTGTLTGRGGDIIIIDDPIKPEEAHSETTRNFVNHWFQSTLASRLNDKSSGAILIVMQRLHEYDLSGMLLEAGGWDLLSLPAIAAEDEVVRLPGGKIHVRRQGDVLHPERESREVLNRQRLMMGSGDFEAQYNQRPLPAKGNVVKAHWLKTYTDISEIGLLTQSWDTACKDDERNDWSVCITARVCGRKCYILDVWRQKVEFSDLWKITHRLAREWRASTLLIEDTGNGTALIQRLRNEQPHGIPSPIARRPKLDKRSRLDAASSMIEAGDLLLPADAPWLATFKAELLGFPSARHDDQVDALSQLMNWVDSRSGDEHIIAAPIYPTLYDD